MDFDVNKPANQENLAENKNQRQEEKERKWRDPNEDVKYVCEGAKVQCRYCSSPLASLKVTAESVMLQDKPWATVGDNNGQANFGFTGICTHPKWGNHKPPCKAVISLGQWANCSGTIIGNHHALLVKSTIRCMVSGENLKIVHSGQTATLSKINPLDKRNAVMEIKVITPLDKGSYNDGTNKTTNLGFVYGETYTLEATAFSNGIPDDKDIKWEAGFIFSNGNMGTVCYKGKPDKWRATGRKVEFSVTELSLLGGTIVFYAYIDSPKQEASLEVWVHYRFRYFDFATVSDEIEKRIAEPWLVDQNSTSLCGMAALFYVFIKNNPTMYKSFVTDIHHKGVATYNGYVVEPYGESKEIMYNMNPFGNDYPHQIEQVKDKGSGKWKDTIKRMPLADWLSLAVLRSHESLRWEILSPNSLSRGCEYIEKVIPYSGEMEQSSMDSLAAVNWPSMMERLCKQFLGYSVVNSVGLSLFLLLQKKHPLRGRLNDCFFDSDLEHLQDMENAYKNGAEIIMVIDSQMFDDIVSYSYNDLFTKSHWIVYEGNLKFYDKQGRDTTSIKDAASLSFDFFTWGMEPNGIMVTLHHPKISIDCFKSTFYGYVVCF